MATSPWFCKQFYGNDGHPAASGWIYAYAAGTLELKDVFEDQALSVPSANPMRLDGNGIAPQYFTGSGLYDFKVYEYNRITPSIRGAQCFSALNIDGNSGGGVTVHNELTDRNAAGAHEIGAIVGLTDALSSAGAIPADAAPLDLATDPVVGVSLKYARQDHAHKRPSLEELGATPIAIGAADRVHEHDASEIVSGVIDPARLPPSGGVIVASGDITSLTTEQQERIEEGAEVVLTSSGMSYIYSGSGSKTDLASYILKPVVVSWDSITGKPALEPALGNPGAGNWFLKTVNAVRSWVQLGALAFKNDFADIVNDPIIDNAYGIPQLDSNGQINILQMGSKLNRANPDFSGSLKQSAVERISATGKFLGVGLNLTNGTANAIPKFDGSKDLVASGLSDDGTTVAVARNQLKAGAGLNSALFSWAGGSPVACWGHATGALDPTKHAIAQNQNWGTSVNSAAGQDLAFTIGNVVKAQLLADGAFKFVGLAGTGTRPVAVDSTGKLVAGGAISERMVFSDFGRIGSGELWQSGFTDNSVAALMLPANSIQNGTRIRIEQEVDLPWDNGAPYQLALGPYLPAGTGPSYPRYIPIINMDDGKSGQGQIHINIEFLGSGASMTAYVTSTQFRRTGADLGPIVYSGEPIPFDATLDRWIDIQFNPNTHAGTEYIIRRNRLFRLDP